ncbi:hypothetical protein [Aestuariivirga litoralis]|uniref:hypothetical protein n=1 Tax=Aestuariivirga litoralis TaxID=2650924 RepID=UPI0018C6DF42|nr:hypothetical protein [Aestuariivirga litoralis]MBG1232279.1 hypothetical protein [Aestuariivirga litoralis]
MKFLKNFAILNCNLCLFAPVAQAASGDTIEINPPAKLMSGSAPFSFGLRAKQAASSGVGWIWFGIRSGDWWTQLDPPQPQNGLYASACTVHGSPAGVSSELQPANPGEDAQEKGFDTGFQCGRAFGMAVNINGCTAKFQAHGYSHTDAPLITYMGFSVLEIELKKRNDHKGSMKVVVYTPAGKNMMSGEVTGAINMPSCNLH